MATRQEINQFRADARKRLTETKTQNRRFKKALPWIDAVAIVALVVTLVWSIAP